MAGHPTTTDVQACVTSSVYGITSPINWFVNHRIYNRLVGKNQKEEIFGRTEDTAERKLHESRDANDLGNYQPLISAFSSSHSGKKGGLPRKGGQCLRQ